MDVSKPNNDISEEEILKKYADRETTVYNEEYVPMFNSTVDLLTQWADIEADTNSDIITIKKNMGAMQKQEDTLNQTNINYRGAYYEHQSLDYLKMWDKNLSYMYYFFAVVLIISLFLAPNTASVTVQILVALFVLVYPYVSIYLVKFIMRWFATVLDLLPKNVYLNMSLENEASRI